MLNWHEEVGLSQIERQRVKKLATAELDRVLAQLLRTRAMLEAMPPADPERAALLERVYTAYDSVTALRQEHLARVAERLPESGRTVKVSLVWLEQHLCSGPYQMVSRGVRQVTFEEGGIEAEAFAEAVGPDEATRSVKPLWRRLSRVLSRRGGELLKFLRSRAQAARRAGCRPARVARHPQRVLTRSVASRSRMVAPVGAPPSIS
jgi:hypothetical protein